VIDAVHVRLVSLTSGDCKNGANGGAAQASTEFTPILLRPNGAGGSYAPTVDLGLRRSATSSTRPCRPMVFPGCPTWVPPATS